MKVTIIPIVIGAFGAVSKGLLKGTGGLEVGGWVKNYPNYGIIENGQNTEKIPGNLRRLVVTQIPPKNHQLKNSQGVNNNNNNHMISECSKLTLNEYKIRHDWVGRVIQGELCKKFKFDHMNKWYMHNLDSVPENETHKHFSDFDIQMDHLILARRPDLMIIKKKKKKREVTELWTLVSQRTTE